MTFSLKHTRYACYIGYITQAIVNNLLPLLFLIFQQQFGLSYERLGGLILINFGAQLVVDILSVRFIDRLGYRKPIIFAHICAVVGLCLLAASPLLPLPMYGSLILSVVIYAMGGGLLEVIVSPMVDAIPAPEEEKGANMSLLHSFYCWGQVATVAVSTLLLLVIGSDRWQVLPIVWAVIPLCNTFLFARVPLADTVPEGERVPLRKLFTAPVFLAALALMVCAGASELTVSQWSSMFAEQGLGLSKVWGDLAGPCLFAVLMGIGRVIYGILGMRIRLLRYMTLLAILCAVCYLVLALSSNPVISLIACALCGFSVSIMWPGAFSLTAGRFPMGGTAMFGILAMCGDIGCSAGPWLAGVIAERAGTPGNLFSALCDSLFTGGGGALKTGLLIGAIFPVIALVCLFFLRPSKEEYEL